MESFDLGIRCDYLAPLDGHHKILRGYFIGVRKNKIEKIAPWIEGRFQAKKWIGTPNQLALPGFINGHTHLPMTLLRGLGEGQNLQNWLSDFIIPLETELVDRDFVYWGTLLASLELIGAGVTTVCDMYYFEDHVARALDEAGLRGLLGETIMDFPTPDDKDAKGHGFDIVQTCHQKFKEHPRIRAAIAPHAPYSCSDQILKKCSKISQDLQVPLIIHVCETKHEVDESLKKYGKTPVRRLFDLGIMSKNTIFAHTVHLSDDDRALMAKTGTSTIYNPESNLKLGSGIADIRKLRSAGVTVGLGTDGTASNNDLSILNEMDTAAKIQSLVPSGSLPLTAQEALELATLEGARALGLSDEIGSLEEGKRADIILMDLAKAHLQPLHDVYSQIAFSAQGEDVATVVCEGQILMENRKFTSLDEDGILAQARVYEEKITKILKTRKNH